MEPEPPLQSRPLPGPSTFDAPQRRLRRRRLGDFPGPEEDHAPIGILSPRAVLIALVALGMVARLVRYAQGIPFWSDECFLAVNFIDRGYLDLMKPLENGQVCPLLFLWIERTAVLALGYSEWSLRLFPLACGLASVVLFERVARRILTGPALLAAVGIFAVSVHPIRHAAEVKPYASDLLAALALLAPATAWLIDRDGPRRLWLLLFVLPFALAISNPALFVAAGILLGLAVPVWKTGRAAERLALASCAAVSIGSFLVLHVGFGGEQSAAAIEGLKRYWAAGFPPLDRPSALPGWLLSALTGSVFAYPGGGARGASFATSLACLVGAIAMIRRGRPALVVALLAPIGLNLIAAALRRYPFGPEARLAQYAAPAICLLAGAGLGAMFEAIRRPRLRTTLVRVGVVALILCVLLPQAASWQRPYRMVHDREARDFARAFWPEVGRDAVVACTYLDFGLGRSGLWQGKRAWYLCNQAICSPQRREGRPRFEDVSGARPLRCVAFDEDPENPEMIAWLARMQSIYGLRAVRSIPVAGTFGDDPRTIVETWRVYEFAPLAQTTQRIAE
ncbi:hypothetical protein [Paludisphaera rhizosphaerae]|uniref:hypothetical protein n=1 Tax=Paludisphaera rhizosphaerae TaxID=2711216 RepID=UPI0013ED1FE2|nr:hypothetical protein [Paludisphaera rhizosphaerae]